MLTTIACPPAPEPVGFQRMLVSMRFCRS